MSTVKPYGCWKSPVTAQDLVNTHGAVQSPQIDQEFVYWLEHRPKENGRYAIVRRRLDNTGDVEDVSAPSANVRSRVHEYGGNSFVVDQGVVYYSHDGDRGVYKQEPQDFGKSLGTPLVPPNSKKLFADFTVESGRNRVICVLEDQSVHEDPIQSEDSIVAIAQDGMITTLAKGRTFYAHARVSPDGSKIAWLAWDHPQMPWDGSEIWVADLNDEGQAVLPRKIAGSPTEASDLPLWSPLNQLFLVNESTNWLNLYKAGNLDEDAVSIQALCPMQAEFAMPLWVFGNSTYGCMANGKLLAIYHKVDGCRIGTIEPGTGTVDEWESELSEMSCLRIGTDGRFAVLLAGSAVKETAVYRLDLSSREMVQISPSDEGVTLEHADISAAQAIEFPTVDNRTAHAFYYPPRNSQFMGPERELPPLICVSHGGPTSRAYRTLNKAYQYWTTRGFAILDVNYGGSTGYGKEYRERLRGKWGVVDVDDCCSAAEHLVREGKVDSRRLIIRGGSAGGYTTLAALTFRNTFQVGVCNYGIGNLLTLLTESHKYESHYLLSVVGPYPEAEALYKARSPVNFVQNLNCAMIFFHGDEDKVVPPSQAIEMYEAVKAKNLPVSLNILKGEQHGFRKADNIRLAIEGQLFFLTKVFKLEPSEDLMPVKIDNL